LVEDVDEYIKEILKPIAKELGCEIIASEVMPDHIHFFIVSSETIRKYIEEQWEKNEKN
jgi:REP element-mobilizing transposase RayT